MHKAGDSNRDLGTISGQPLRRNYLELIICLKEELISNSKHSIIKKLFLFLLLIMSCSPIFGQEKLYLPLEFKKAYENETRSKDGSVSAGYWQNKATYNIEAGIDVKNRLLKGSAVITYFNNSPDTLRSVTFHTYQDYLKPYSSRKRFDGSKIKAEDHQGMVIGHVIIAEDTVDLNNPQQVIYGGTNYSIRLSDPLPPSENLDLQIFWNYEIPVEGQLRGRAPFRSGAYDSTSMFVGYWYPEIAVRDDIHGWDTKAFDPATEFYHDFSDYKISLTLPEEFTVWASVPPDNPGKVYSGEVQNRLEKARESNTAVQILTQEDFRTGSGATKTWNYTAKEFPDFAFAFSDHYLWEAATYIDEKGDYLIQTAYSYANPGFGEILPTLATSLKIFHRDFPKYPFPYKFFTVFDGMEMGGMEFPGMANDGLFTKEIIRQLYRVDPSDEEVHFRNLTITLHEMAHMYFPFMMGINEKKYAWMDEGFALASAVFIEDWKPVNESNFNYLGSLNAVPPMVPSNEHDNSFINSIVGSAAYLALYELLGDKLFHNGLHAFMDEWKHKHPTPYDFMFTFNSASGRDLTWFWKAWLFEWGYMDLGIKAIEGHNVQVENSGGRPMTFKIVTTYENGKNIEERISPAVWENSSLYTHAIPGSQPIKEVRLEFSNYPDAVKENNVWRREE